MTTRVVITGLGVITPLGDDLETNWQLLLQGKSGIDFITSFNSEALKVHIAGEIKSLDSAMMPANKHQLDRAVILGLIAVEKLLTDAQFYPDKSSATGLIVGTGFGTIQSKEEHYIKIGKDPSHSHPIIILTAMDNAPASEIAIKHGLKGINQTIFTACSSGLNAIGNAYRLIKDGYEERVIAGGVDSPITPNLLHNWSKLRLISRSMQPQKASKPFSKGRDGFVISEGAGFILLENYEKAIERGAKIYAEITGFSSNCDAQHLTTPDYLQQSKVIDSAIKEAGINKEEIQYINAHGTATTINDQVETKAIKNSFGTYSYQIPISALKSQLGHTMGAAGAIETIFTVLMMQRGKILPTINFEEADPTCDLNCVPNVPIEKSIKYALKTSFGFGGNNSAIVIKRY